MQLEHPNKSGAARLGRNLSYFLAVPLAAMVVIGLVLAFTLVTYQSNHNGRIYSGVSVWGVDVGQMSPAEALEALSDVFPYAREQGIQFIDPASGQQWTKAPEELGMGFDLEATVETALSVGRVGGPGTQLQEMFESWYYGLKLSPVLVFDQGRLEESLAELAAQINEPVGNASIGLEGATVTYTAAEIGRSLDVVDLRQRLEGPIKAFQQAEVELLIHEIPPVVQDDAATINQLLQLAEGDPFVFYLDEPLHDGDLKRFTVSKERLLSWLRVELVTQSEGSAHHKLLLDENGVRHWVSQIADEVYREPVNARFYFNDDTRELVLVSPHVNGRALDVDATVAEFVSKYTTPDRSIALALEQIVPTVHSGATSVELGITELITQTTTWFYGSSDARKHNIARSASNFYGIVVAPGEEFSFNRYLGTVTEDDGYEEGLIIVGGRTIKGIGGGVCQVSTTMFQTAFWAGFPISERWEHGYMLGYYNDGEGPGMDATVFSPIVDFRFINNTPHHLLIENYYNEINEALTFKFYSTSMGRRVEKGGPVFENIVPAPAAPDEDEWEFDEDLVPGTVRQIDWATDGADVTVQRIVYNADGDELINEFFASNYIPYPNVYHYGPDVEAPAYSLLPSN
jgi:vancomycin resistance protein YoaR